MIALAARTESEAAEDRFSVEMIAREAVVVAARCVGVDRIRGVLLVGEGRGV